MYENVINGILRDNALRISIDVSKLAEGGRVVDVYWSARRMTVAFANGMTRMWR